MLLSDNWQCFLHRNTVNRQLTVFPYLIQNCRATHEPDGLFECEENRFPSLDQSVSFIAHMLEAGQCLGEHRTHACAQGVQDFRAENKNVNTYLETRYSLST